MSNLSPTPESPGSRPDLVPERVVCMRCGYALSGLPREGDCPECALSLSPSIRWLALHAANPTTLDVARSGLRLTLVGVIVVAFVLPLLVLGTSLIPPTHTMAHRWSPPLTAIVLIAGLWTLVCGAARVVEQHRVSSPGTNAPRRPLSIWAGIIAIGAAVLLAGMLSIYAIGNYKTIGPWLTIIMFAVILAVITMIATVAHITLMLRYLRSLAARAASEKLVIAARRCTFVLPLVAAGLVAVPPFVLGVALSLMVYAWLVISVRRRIDVVMPRWQEC